MVIISKEIDQNIIFSRNPSDTSMCQKHSLYNDMNVGDNENIAQLAHGEKKASQHLPC